MTIVGLDQIARQLAVATQPQSVAPTLTRRQGTISAVNAGPPVSVDVTVGGVIIPAVRYLATYVPVVSDVVFVDFNGADPLVIGTLAPAPSRAVPGVTVARAVPTSGNTASATYVDFPGPYDMAFTKRSASTYLSVDLRASGFATVATGAMLIGVRINAVDYDIAQFYFNDLSSHRAFSAVRPVASGLAVGVYTARLRWAMGGGATANVNADDLMTLTIQEINPT